MVQQIFKRLLAQLAKKELKQGLKEAGERATKEVARGGMRGLGKRAVKGGLEEAAEESGISLATQAYQNSTGRRHGLDLADLGASAVGGLAGGAVAPLAGLGRHAHGPGARIAEHFGREMTGETLAEGAAGLATGQGVMSVEDAARAAVSGATGSATGQVDAAVRARIDGQLTSLAAPLPPMELPVAPPAVAAGADLPSPRDGSPPEAGGSTPTVLSGGLGAGAGAALTDASPPAPLPDRETLAVEPVPTVQVGSAADPRVPSSVMVEADAAVSAQAEHGRSSDSPTLSSVTTERPPSPQTVEAATAAGHTTTQPTAANPATSATVSTAPVTASVTTTTAATVTSPATGTVGNTATSIPPTSASVSASAHTPVAAAHNTAAALTPPSVQRPSPVVGEEPAPQQGVGAPERDAAVTNAPRANRFPSLEALAPAPATSPPSEAQTPPGPATELPRPRTPEWYAAKWAAEREALERRRYRGYFESQRAWYEDRRRRDLAGHLLESASHYLDRARWLKQRARDVVKAGLTLRAEHMFKASEVAERDSYEYTDWADGVRTGKVVPDEVLIDDPADFQRINDDVADLALGAVETSDQSALTGADGDPPPIDRSRRYGQWGGLRPPLALHQTDLERQMPRNPDGSVVRTADPRQGGWFGLANDGGPEADPTRGINCLDCTLSLYETWVHGRPRVSAPRTFDGYSGGDIRRPILGEKNGPQRVEEVTGGRFQNLVGGRERGTGSPTPLSDAVDRGFDNLHVQLKIGGHGSYAFLITEWENGGSHAWVALNQNGTILYLDPQSGVVHDQPLYRHQGVTDPDNVVSIDALVLGGDGRPMPLGGLARGQFSVLPDLPDYPSTPDEEAGYGDPYLNRLHLLDGPGAASVGSGPARDGGTTAGPDLAREANEPLDEQEELRRARQLAYGEREAAGLPTREVVAANADLDAVFGAGVTPAEVAAHLDAPTLRRLAPHLDDAAARDVARLLADPRVDRMLDETWRTPPYGEPMLAEALVRQLTQRPDLVRMILATPELANSLTARPLTLHHLAVHQQAVDVLGAVLDDIAARSAEVVAAETASAEATPLTDEQRRISNSFTGTDDLAVQPGFDLSRRSDPSYRKQYLDWLYQEAVVAQVEVTALAERLAGRAGGSATAEPRPGPKDRQRAEDKVSKYRFDVSLLTDLAAAKVVFTRLDDLYQALGELRSDPGVRIVEFEDRFISPQVSGYRDVQMMLRTANGHVAEFRLHLAALDEVATWEHALYEVRRDLKAVADQDRRSMSSMEHALRKGILRQERQYFWVALRETLDRGQGIE
ncbi:toxin glutamine deamidase domain-containing protein [Micromonospora sp. NPDC050200]|uniref:toxin glutamine deamidase domain-containing protein n=1 Tax=Micromonospora sp. NPDC050200 TaxID=3155664 RepID=UPI0033E2642A